MVAGRRARLDFPALAGGAAVYLDSASTTQKPRAVIEAVTGHYEGGCGGVHRATHAFALRATAALEGGRAAVARFLGSQSENEIVFVRNATEAINLVASSWARPRLRPGDEIVVSALEHHSNLLPWRAVCDESGAVLRTAACDAAGAVDVAAAIGARTRLVAVTHVSNALGTVLPIAEIAAAARAVGAAVLVDGAQAAGHVPVNVAALGCDFYAMSGHKAYGPAGIGALYARADRMAQMRPYQHGGEMVVEVDDDHVVHAEGPHRFEAGTPATEAVVGLAAALGYLEALGRGEIHAREAALRREARARLGRLPGVRVLGPEAGAAVLSFVVEGVHPHDVATVAEAEGVALRAGHHCAQPLMARLGVAGTARASFGVYSEPEDVLRLEGAVRRCLEIFRA